MRPTPDDKADTPEGPLLIMFTEITDRMMTICTHLTTNSGVAAVTRGCDIRRYQDSMREEEVYCFESYVEATTHTGELFCWLLDITLTSLGWQFQRYVTRQTDDGERYEPEFEDITFEKFDDLANNYMALMIDFEESAKNFDFRP